MHKPSYYDFSKNAQKVKSMANKLCKVGKNVHKVISELIGLLLIVLALDPILGFLPWWLSTALGVIIISLIVYEYQPRLTKPVWGSFAEKLSVRFTSVVYVCVTLLFLKLEIKGVFEDTPLSFSLILAAIFGSLPIIMVVWGWLFSKQLKEDELVSFWGILVGSQERATRGWKETKSIHKSLIETFDETLWRYLPGAIMTLFLLLTLLLFTVFEYLSVLFAFILLIWLVERVHSFRKKARSSIVSSENVDLQKIVYFLVGQNLFSAKGIFGLICIIVGFLIASIWIFMAFAVFYMNSFLLLIFQQSSSENFFLLVFVLLWASLFAPSGVYQFYFWYVMLKRYGKFVSLWNEKNFSKEINTIALPIWGDISFLISCLLPTFIVIIASIVGHFLIPFIISSSFCVFYSFLLLSSIRRQKHEREIYPEKLYRDNLRIPIALFFTTTSVTLVALVFSFFQFSGGVDIKEYFGPMFLGLLLCSFFYLEDWWRWTESKFRDSLREIFLHWFGVPILLFPPLLIFAFTFPYLKGLIGVSLILLSGVCAYGILIDIKKNR